MLPRCRISGASAAFGLQSILQLGVGHPLLVFFLHVCKGVEPGEIQGARRTCNAKHAEIIDGCLRRPLGLHSETSLAMKEPFILGLMAMLLRCIYFRGGGLTRSGWACGRCRAKERPCGEKTTAMLRTR